ncbi:hypothetical protein NIES4072_07940 [Nostoc commune NIES-4072]|uniref:Uncharacterized protein n=1 Tax=Nostoc commune NIES-4072 TaxID=2005467 RepID=A0A2R5FGA9_NOSCO|nr:DUF3140 domain-containing protein [Nostoc commune]BBD65531.1 hypothetical protein NIES4070_18890 [Nostoc commune HK-02]GBG17145.1 hypothetical protein NIES4072_07940 [Nostoc commune NIES-4072]
MSKDVKSVIADFHQVVNMTPKELEFWLDTDESQTVGQKDGDDESIGHKSGRRIIQLKYKHSLRWLTVDGSQSSVIGHQPSCKCSS